MKHTHVVRNKVDFFVNEEKGVVACKISNVCRVFAREAEKKG